MTFLDCGPLSLTLKSPEIIGLSGVSGSGKSRLLRALADLDEHQGEVVLDGINQQAIAAHEWRKRVALLSAETHWWFDTVEAHFLLSDESSRVMCKQALSALGFVENSLQWSVARLSSGEKQRLGLLRLLQNKPDVLLLDEPTANLDKQNTLLFENYVMHYLHSQSACAIWVSHDIEQLQRICQRRYNIESGMLIHVN